MVTGLGSLEMASEGLIDDLRDGQAVQVGLTPDRHDLAAFDMKGDAFGLLGGIAGLRGEVYPAPDLVAVPTSTAPMSAPPVSHPQDTAGVVFQPRAARSKTMPAHARPFLQRW